MRIYQRLMIFVALLFVVASMSACAKGHTNVARLDPNKECPPNEQCLSFVSDGNDFWGGGRHKATVLHGGESSFYDKDNGRVVTVKNAANVVNVSANADRGDTYGPAIINAATQFGVVKIQTDAYKDVAETQADAAKKQGPQQVFILSSSSRSSGGSGGSAFALNAPGPTTAVAQQTTDVGVGVGIETTNTQGGSKSKTLDPDA